MLLFDLIPSCQSGFRPLHSTEYTLHDLTNKCFQAMEHGEVTGSVFIDLSKAFEVTGSVFIAVKHLIVLNVILLEKFKRLNMSTSLINWFKSYLSGRSRSVNIEGSRPTV